MNRRELTDILRQREWAATELARHFQVPVGEIIEDLQHIQKSLRHADESIAVDPALCRKCGFRFSADKMNKPSRCPDCKGNRIRDPLMEIQSDSG
jgi:transcriptional regulator